MTDRFDHLGPENRQWRRGRGAAVTMAAWLTKQFAPPIFLNILVVIDARVGKIALTPNLLRYVVTLIDCHFQSVLIHLLTKLRAA